jgi:membrane protein DedA with SNARE-associated domain
MTNLSILFQNFIQALRSGQLPQLGTWTYILLAALVAVEGPIATLLGAAAASAGLMKPVWVFVAAASGNLTADSLWYMLGYIGKIDWLLRFGKKLGIQADVLARLENGMREHTKRILFVAKLTLSMMIPALIAAGLVKAPWRHWFPAIFTGEMLWTGSLVLIGFYTTEAIKRVERGVEYAALGGAIVFVMFLIMVGRRVVKKRYQSEINPMEND